MSFRSSFQADSRAGPTQYHPAALGSIIVIVDSFSTIPSPVSFIEFERRAQPDELAFMREALRHEMANESHCMNGTLWL
jgi:hypothetical protein